MKFDNSDKLVWALNLLLLNGISNHYAVDSGSLAIKTFAALSLISAMFFIYSSAFSEFKSWDKPIISYENRVMIAIILIIGVINIFRSLTLEFKAITDTLALPGTGMAWLMPVAIYCGVNIKMWEKIISVFRYHILIGVLLIIAYKLANINFLVGSPEFINWSCLYPSGFLLLNWRNQSKKTNMIGMIGFSFFAINGFMMGRRYLVLVSFIYFIFFLKSLIFKTSFIFKGFFVHSILLGSILSFILIYPHIENIGERINNEANSSSNMVFKKGFDNSRKGFVHDLFGDLTFNEALFGRGVLGRYHSFKLGAPYDSTRSTRGNIEIGYLQIVLKCGLLMLFAYIVLVFPSTIVTVLFNSNSFALAAGYTVLNRLLEMFVFGLPSATCSYLLFWLAVGVCLGNYSKNRRRPRPAYNNESSNTITLQKRQ